MNQPQKQEQDSRIPYPDNTVFLVPDIAYDIQVIRGYLNKKYKNIPKDMIASQVSMAVIPHLEQLKLIVCVRRGRDGGAPGLAYDTVTDDKGNKREMPIKPESYHDEVVESPSIRVRDYIVAPKMSLFALKEPDLNPLIDLLAEHAIPCRIFPQNKPDVMLRCVVGV